MNISLNKLDHPDVVLVWVRVWVCGCVKAWATGQRPIASPDSHCPTRRQVGVRQHALCAGNL